MTDVLKRREFALWAVAAMFGVACSKPDRPSTTLPIAELGPGLRRVRKRIRKHVGDRERREAALKLLDEAAKTLAQLGIVLEQWREATALLPDEQRRDRARVLAITRAYSEEIGAVMLEAATIGVALREHITAGEWPLVFPPPEANGRTSCSSH